ncbi:MAG: alkaline phosphatase family protein [Peptococcaceae bacterium]|nr:alkaline phosphatase family protein [Peptococcaceae bacterium]
MTMEAKSKKILVLGVDGADPRLTRTYIDQGLLPNTAELLRRGAAREDLVMLGAQPTVTPPMWTTLATGAYPITHGITCYNRRGQDLDEVSYNLDSRLCKAEQLWNVTAEAGYKTLVWHWPGSSWPPSSDNPNLMVVDGVSPPVINTFALIEEECLVLGSPQNAKVEYRAKAASDSKVPCVVREDEFLAGTDDESSDVFEGGSSKKIITDLSEGEHSMSATPFDLVITPIAPVDHAKWAAAPADAKEFTVLYSGGLIRRPALILKNEDGIYDSVALYRSKNDTEPYAVIPKGVFYEDVIDDAYYHNQIVKANRNVRILDMGEDGESLRMWISNGVALGVDDYFHPRSLYHDVIANVGPIPPLSLLGGGDRLLLRDCMYENWEAYQRWTARALNYMIEQQDVDIIFSQMHNIDLQGHMIVKFLKDHGHNVLSEEEYADMMVKIYQQTDRYIGEFLHLLDEGWTILYVSDHAQVCGDYEPLVIGDPTGVSTCVMEELGLTKLKVDDEGNRLHEIDWENTYAVQQRGNHIYLNIKGRDQHVLKDGTVIDGIIDPADQYEWEEEIMTRLYGYKHPVSGKRVIALALRNRDAILLGMGGPLSGDILFWNAEGYNYDHCDSLSTTYGYAGTSVSPIFIAAGKGIKENYLTERIIRQVDVAPTVAVLAGVRMPAQCEGAPVYQILED